MDQVNGLMGTAEVLSFLILALNQDRALREVLGEGFCKLVHFSVGRFMHAYGCKQFKY
jgi:hypothetical protein